MGDKTVHPIIMSAPMVRALLDGRKTQTRRVVKNVFRQRTSLGEWDAIKDLDGSPSRLEWAPENWEICPYGVPGDLLWVRETHGPLTLVVRDGELSEKVFYRATDEQPRNHRGELIRWRPSIHMPRWASRLTLEVTAVGVERVQEISATDAQAEGVPTHVVEHTFAKCYRDVDERAAKRIEYFSDLWDALNAKRGYSWESNPWVWVLMFKVHQRNVDDMLREREAA